VTRDSEQRTVMGRFLKFFGSTVLLGFVVSVSANVFSHWATFKHFEGALVAGNGPTPDNECLRSRDSSSSGGTILVGTNAFRQDDLRDFSALRIHDEDLIVLEADEQGIWVNAVARDAGGRIVARIVRNKFLVNEHASLTFDQPTKSKLRVEDDEGHTALEV